MAIYHYTAIDKQGHRETGSVEAQSIEQARTVLRERGLQMVEVAESENVSSSRVIVESLSIGEATELAQYIAQLSASNIPLAAGLRAAAKESQHGRVGSSLLWIATRIDQGQSLEAVLTGSGTLLPKHINGLLLAALRTGTFGSALLELVEHQQAMRELRQDFLRGYGYPLTVAASASLILLFIIEYVTKSMEQMFTEFELQLPMITRLLLWWRETGVLLLAAGIGCLAIIAVLYRLRVGKARWRWLVMSIPLFGPMFLWAGAADWAGLLGLLLKYEVPLPEALRLAGYGVHDAGMGQLSMRLADGVSRGRSLSQLINTLGRLPASLIPFIRWGENTGTLANSLVLGQEMLQQWVRVRALLLQSIVPPIMFIVVGSILLFVVTALFLPLIDLITCLS